MKSVETIITDITAEKSAIVGYPKKYEDFAGKYDEVSRERLIGDLFMKERLCNVYMRRLENAREVIDLIAEELDLAGRGHYLYGPVDGETPIVEKNQTVF